MGEPLAIFIEWWKVSKHPGHVTIKIINSLRGGSQMIHRNYGTTMNADSWKWPNLARVPKTIEDLSTVDYPKTLALVANFPLYQASVLFRSNERAFFCTLVQF